MKQRKNVIVGTERNRENQTWKTYGRRKGRGSGRREKRNTQSQQDRGDKK